MVKNVPDNARDAGLMPGWGRTLGAGNGNPLQYSCQENPMDRGAWQATVHANMAQQRFIFKVGGKHTLFEDTNHVLY